MLQVEISLRKWFGGTAHLRTFTGSQGRNQLFISGGGQFSWNFIRWRHRDYSTIQPRYNFFANGHR